MDAADAQHPTVTVFLLILIAVGMEVAGQLLYKSGINRMQGLSGSPFRSWALVTFAFAALGNWRVLAGIGIYCAQAAVWWGVLSRVNLSYAFPLTSLSYVFVLVGSRAFLGERISVQRWLGAVAVVFGVYLITRTAPVSRTPAPTQAASYSQLRASAGLRAPAAALQESVSTPQNTPPPQAPRHIRP